MQTSRPHLVVLAGPNGAGKTTASADLLAGTLRVDEFVNADTIARGLSEFHPERAALEAGRIMLARLHQLAGQRANFAFETTLASRSFAPWIADLQRDGYAFHLVYFWLHSPEEALARVKDRVASGGHDVPERTVRRRYRGGLVNFFQLYQPLADSWRFYGNSSSAGPRRIAWGELNQEPWIDDIAMWDQIVREYGHDPKSKR
jgi:predicted ABC-type ATPase